jgi:hypothetical protein
MSRTISFNMEINIDENCQIPTQLLQTHLSKLSKLLAFCQQHMITESSYGDIPSEYLDDFCVILRKIYVKEPDICLHAGSICFKF